MFGNMVFHTYLVASGAENLREAIKLFWTFRIPWEWTYSGSIFPDWVAQFRIVQPDAHIASDWSYYYDFL